MIVWICVCVFICSCQCSDCVIFGHGESLQIISSQLWPWLQSLLTAFLFSDTRKDVLDSSCLLLSSPRISDFSKAHC